MLYLSRVVLATEPSHEKDGLRSKRTDSTLKLFRSTSIRIVVDHTPTSRCCFRKDFDVEIPANFLPTAGSSTRGRTWTRSGPCRRLNPPDWAVQSKNWKGLLWTRWFSDPPVICLGKILLHLKKACVYFFYWCHNDLWLKISTRIKYNCTLKLIFSKLNVIH